MEKCFILVPCFRGFGQWPTGCFGLHLWWSSISRQAAWHRGCITSKKHRWGGRGRQACGPNNFYQACPQWPNFFLLNPISSRFHYLPVGPPGGEQPWETGLGGHLRTNYNTVGLSLDSVIIAYFVLENEVQLLGIPSNDFPFSTESPLCPSYVLEKEYSFFSLLMSAVTSVFWFLPSSVDSSSFVIPVLQDTETGHFRVSLTLTPCALSCQPPWIVSGIVSPLPLLLLVLREVTVESQRSADSVSWIWLFNSLAFEVGFLFCYFLLLLNILSGNLSGAYICFLVH